MNLLLVIKIIGAIETLLSLRGTQELSSLHARVDELRALLTAELPAKPDGSAWTDDDVRALAQQARASATSILDRTS